MWCEINKTDYKSRLVAQLGDRNAKEFAMATDTQKFKEWFGKGKTVVVDKKVTVPFVNPIMQIFNEKNEAFNLLERYRFQSFEDVTKFFNPKYTPGVTIHDDVYTIGSDSNRYINEKAFQEIERIYPNLFTKIKDDTYILNTTYNFKPVEQATFGAASKEAIEQARELIDNMGDSPYKAAFAKDVEEALLTVAVQANSSNSERNGAIKTFGHELVNLAQETYPDAKVGDTIAQYRNSEDAMFQRADPKTQDVIEGMSTLLDSLSNRFNIPYKLVNDANANWRGKFDPTGVTINVAKVKGDTAFHEFAHPFIMVLEKENPALYKAMIQHMFNTVEGNGVMESIIKHYPELNIHDKQQEGLVTFLGKVAAIKHEAQSPIIERFIKWLKSLFKKVNMVDFKNLSLNTTFNELADMLVDPTTMADLKSTIRNANSVVKYQKTSPDTDITFAAVFDRIKDRVAILNATIKKRKQGEQFKDDINSLNNILASQDEITSISKFMQNSLGYVQAAKQRFDSLRDAVKDPSKLTKDELANNMYILGEIQQLLNVYESLEDVQLLYEEEEDKHPPEELTALGKAIKQQKKMVKDFKPFALTHVTEWLYPYLEPTHAELKAKGFDSQIITKDQFREQLEMATRDIDFASYLLGASINSRDPISAAVGLALKDIIYDNHVKDLETQEVLAKEYQKERGKQVFTTQEAEDDFNLQFLREIDNFEQTGVDPTGKPTWGYVKRLAFHTEFNEAEYQKVRREFFKGLGDKPNKVDAPEAYKKYQLAVAQFYGAHTQINPNTVSIIREKKTTLSTRQYQKWVLANTVEMEDEIYSSGKTKADYFKESGKLFNYNAAKKTFRVIAGDLIKPSELYRNKDFAKMMANSYYAETYRAYQKANEKLGQYGLNFGIIPQQSKGKNMFSELSWKKGIKENLKTFAKNRVKSVEANEDSGRTVQRQDGSEVKHVPIKYTKLLDQSDLKVDLLSSVLKFSQMANSYESMTEVEPNILVLKTLLNGDTNLGIKGRAIGKTTASGKGVINAITKKLVPKASQEERLNKRLNEFIDDVVFGEDEFEENFSVLGKEFSMNKVAGQVGLFTSLSNMALNFTGGINNVVVGNYNNVLEAVGGRFWGKKDWAWAQKEYWAMMPETIGALVGQTESHLGNLAGHYDVPQGEFMNEFGDKVSGGFLNKGASTSTLYFIQKGGEHQIQLTGLLSLMKATKVKDSKSNEVSLYEAWKNGSPVKNPEYQWTKEDDGAFRNRLHAINKSLHGVYNKFDKSTLQRRWYGKLALMFRKYMFTAFKSRYGGTYTDYELGTVNQGYWIAFMKKFKDDVVDYKWGMIQRMWTKEGYNELEKNAMNRTLFEIGVILSAMVLAGMVDADDDKSWLTAEAALQLTRMSADITQFIHPGDFLRVVKNPAASVNLVQKWGSVLMQLSSPTEEYSRKAGFAKKGDNKLRIKLLKALPVVRQFINLMTPEEQIKFYNLTGR